MNNFIVTTLLVLILITIGIFFGSKIAMSGEHNPLSFFRNQLSRFFQFLSHHQIIVTSILGVGIFAGTILSITVINNRISTLEALSKMEQAPKPDFITFTNGNGGLGTVAVMEKSTWDNFKPEFCPVTLRNFVCLKVVPTDNAPKENKPE